MAAKGRKERKAKILEGKEFRQKFFQPHPSPSLLLCVLCALSRLNFGVRVEAVERIRGYEGE